MFDCASTRTVYVDVTVDYGTDAILQTIRRFTSIRGCPAEIRSDQGSQLISAAKDVAKLVESWDWKSISTWTTNQKIRWTVVPAEGQHQNGFSSPSRDRLSTRSVKMF